MPKQQILRAVPDKYSREAGPAIITIGSVVWKVISWASNIDFVLSLQSERFGVIMQTFQDWGWIIVVIGGVLWGVREYKSRETRADAQEGAVITGGLLASCIGIAFIFGVLLAVSSAGSMPQVVQEWGPGSTPTGPACVTVMDTSHLKQYQGKFEIAGICGLTDPTIDLYSDPTITISKPFTITGGSIQIVAVMSKEMAQKLMPIAPASLSSSPPPIAPTQQSNINLWYKAALIPDNLDMSNIKTLNDIKRVGGKVFDPALWN